MTAEDHSHADPEESVEVAWECRRCGSSAVWSAARVELSSDWECPECWGSLPREQLVVLDDVEVHLSEQAQLR